MFISQSQDHRHCFNVVWKRRHEGGVKVFKKRKELQEFQEFQEIQEEKKKNVWSWKIEERKKIFENGERKKDKRSCFLKEIL